jgi:hypothetical protein
MATEYVAKEMRKGVQEMEGLLMEGDHTEPGHREELAVSG